MNGDWSKTKHVWTDADFSMMSWHDCRVYGIEFPKEDFSFRLGIDYIFEWVKAGGGNFSGFWVAPCELTFFNVSDFEISLKQRDEFPFSLGEIKRGGERVAPNGKLREWGYEIQFDQGWIRFLATGYSMRLMADPILSAYQDLGRN